MLNIKRENLKSTKVKLTVNLPPELMRSFFAKVYNKIAPEVTVKGFRPGKAPKNLTINAIGENRLMSEIIDLALRETYVEALKQEKLLPIAPPKINVKKMSDLTTDNANLEYEAEVDLLPEIKLGDYKKIKVKKIKEPEVKKEEIEQVLNHLQRQMAEFKDIDRPAKEGDRVEIDFEGTEKGVILENFSSKNYPAILGSKVLIPEFEKNLVGMKKGEEKEFTVSMPAGKEKKKVDFKVKMLDVKEVILPDLNEELAKKVGSSNIDELKKAIEKDILAQKQSEEQRKQETELAEGILKSTQLEVPDSLVDQEIHRMIEQMKQRAQMAGIPFESYLAQIKKTEDDLHNEFREQAEKTVKFGLILGEIGKLESANWQIDLKEQEAGRKIVEKLLEIATK